MFFWDPLEPQMHDPDVKALLPIAVVWDIPVACNLSTADFLISSPLMTSDYVRATPQYGAHIDRGGTHHVTRSIALRRSSNLAGEARMG